jgi:predicted TIM-barrel fold metal-dependent hydrolase
MIIDSHCHAWETWPYDQTVPDPDSRGRVEQLLFEMDRAGVERSVIVSAAIDFNPDNNDYVAHAVAQHPDRLVQLADVDSFWRREYHLPGSAARLRAAAERASLVGVTHYLGETNDGWLRSDEAHAFVRAAADLDLIISLAASPAWLADVRAIASAHPSVPILLHHLGLSGAGEGAAEGLAEVLACEQVPSIAVKVSGFYYGSEQMFDYPWPDRIEVFRRIHEAFGPTRLAWGSDFPVSPWVACTYVQSLEVVRTSSTFLPADDLRWILGGTMDEMLQTRRPVTFLGRGDRAADTPAR